MVDYYQFIKLFPFWVHGTAFLGLFKTKHMPEDLNKFEPKQDATDQNLKNATAEGNEDRFESDTQKIVHRHLENKEDVITDDDIRNVRVGMTPTSMDEPTEARFEGDDAIDEVEEKYIGHEPADQNQPGSNNPINPWDTLDSTK